MFVKFLVVVMIYTRKPTDTKSTTRKHLYKRYLRVVYMLYMYIFVF